MSRAMQRHPAGQSTGGRFARRRHRESTATLPVEVQDLEAWRSELAPYGLNDEAIAQWADMPHVATPHDAGLWMRSIRKLHPSIQTDLADPALLRFVTANVARQELVGDRPHPVVVATARYVSVDESQIAAKVPSDGSKTPVDVCRTTLRRRRIDPAF